MRGKRPPDPVLTLEEIAAGMSAALDNARSLLDDAEILLQNGSYARSLSCILVAEQEAGKVSVLRSMARIDSTRADHWKVKWRNFRSHGDKGAHGLLNILPDEYRQNPKALLAKAIEIRGGDAEDAEQARRRCLYIDFEPDSHSWLTPTAVPETVVVHRLRLANQMVSRVEGLRLTGFFRPEVLAVEHEVYVPYTRTLPATDPSSPEDLETMISHQEDLIRRYIALLFRKELLQLDLDITFMGKSLRDWLGPEGPDGPDSQDGK